MNIDWSKAPEGRDVHIAWPSGHEAFYRVERDRYVRDGGWLAYIVDVQEAGAVVTHRPVWDGAGLPPVGGLVDAEINSGARYMVTVLAVEGEFAAVQFPGQLHIVHISCMRPIRTHEQVAAEERDSAIQQMAMVALQDSSDLISRISIERLYDAGYRKKTTTE